MNIRPATPDDIERLLALNSQAFNTPVTQYDRIRSMLTIEHWRVAEENGRVVGTVRAFPFAHYFGGSSVAATGVASVAIAPEARGRGIATALMSETLREQRAPISSLYPATVPIYRSAGYGFGFHHTTWKARLNDLPQTTQLGVEIEAFEPTARGDVDELYVEIARASNGLIARDKEWWDTRVVKGWDDSLRYCYRVRENGATTGWIIFQLKQAKESWQPASIAARDLFWTTPGSARALLSLAALHRSTGQMIEWVGPHDEQLVHLVHDHAIEIDDTFRGMLRLLDVPAAFEARGYNPSVDVVVSFAVEDALLPRNNGPWRIEVSDGSAKVVETDSADARVTIQTLASIWAGMMLARDAVRTGGLRADTHTVEALEAMFAGPLPWIADFF